MFLINGQESHSLSVHDRSIHYGDGVFETIAVKNSTPLCWEQHLRRLIQACDRLAIDCPDTMLLKSESVRLCENRNKAVLKLIISRGRGARGYQASDSIEPTRILSVHDWPEYTGKPEMNGVNVEFCKLRLGHAPMLAGMKHLNRLEQVLLRTEVAQRRQLEGIVLDIDDNVIEGTMSNVFLVKRDKLITPSLDLCGVAGIVRGLIADYADQWGLLYRAQTIKSEELSAADEVFFCNSIIGIWPVSGISRQVFSPGPITQKIRSALITAGYIIV